ncbi:PepSY domain-containing protein [Knoellia sp. S7-12]|uniref:PepSY-associated TM helix domain-containing protein n=1 Tax=Knoellia sp. S7-12 TaxID=3126698 RepID=UPI003369999D
MSVIDDPTPPSPTSPAAQADPVAKVTGKTNSRGRHTGLFRAFWRWHFYASVVVIPVLLVLAITGLVYLFRFKIEPALHGDLMRVEASVGQPALPYEMQRFNAATAHPDDTIVSMTEPGAPDQSTRFTLTTPSDETRDVFVNPYTAEVLGDLNPDTTLSGRAIRLHADLMGGRIGDLVMELGACWAIVMAITGYYLFLKGRRARKRQRDRGVRSAMLRSTHARIGSVMGVGLLLLIVSGLPWTGVWGAQVQKLVTGAGTSMWPDDHGALSNPTSTLDESLPHSHHVVPWAQEKTPVPTSPKPPQADGEVSIANVDTAITVGAHEGLARPMTVALPADDEGVFSAIGYAFNDPTKERTVHVDQYGGDVASTYGYDDYPGLAKVVSQGIALHEGRRFGTLNMVLTTLFCLAVIASCITGPLMWWRRRPRGSGSVGAPRGRMPLAASPALAVGIVALGVFLPVMGVSLAIVLLLDRLVLSRLTATRRLFGATSR